MKTTINLLAAIIVLFITASCSNSGSSDITPAGTSENLSQGLWTVTFFEERGENETSKFSGYQMSFDSGGVFRLISSTNNYTGSWSVNKNSDDNSNSSQKLIIYISGNNVADQLQDDWIIVSQTENSIHLQDDSSNHTETLKLQRN